VIVKNTFTEVSRLDVVGVRNQYEICAVILYGLLLNLSNDLHTSILISVSDTPLVWKFEFQFFIPIFLPLNFAV